MQFDMIVLDLDGTLTNGRKEITEVTKEVLLAYQEAGGKVVLASGRPTFGVMPLAKELELDRFGSYILSFNGGVITECGSERILYEQELPADVPGRLWELSKEYGTSMLTYQGDYIITETPQDQFVQKEVTCTKMQVKKVENLKEYVDFPVTKCMLMEKGIYLADVEIKVKEALGDSLSIYRSEPYFLEVMAEGIDKAQSLARLLEIVGIPVEKMAAFGDGFNDKSMIMFAGLGVAMENGQAAVKAVADYVAPSNEEDGVAYVVEKILNGERL
ncbi:MAG: Cof-type HAD-IIB family hydrolase [Lachnospiraceae bacterium]|nr:Cof-type HAD-IIB family hydrolase [Lachnospiraceae bacterium]